MTILPQSIHIKRLYVLLVFLLLVPAVALAQIRTFSAVPMMMSSGSGSHAEIFVSDSVSRDALLGATVRIISGRDTIVGATTKKIIFQRSVASFECLKRLRQPVEMTVTFMGYKPYVRKFAAKDFVGRIYAQMQIEPKMISTIEVKGKIISMIVRGDTTVYNADAFKTMEGDKLRELLVQLPGVEVKENEIYANGEKVTRVYVDNQTFFGDDTGAALRDLTAADVKNVKVYEEDNPTAKRIGDTNAPKDKVMDVTTKSKPKVIRNIKLILSGGSSTQKEYGDNNALRHNEYFMSSFNRPTNSMSLTAYNQRNSMRRDLTNYVMSDYRPPTPSRNTQVSADYSYRRADSVKYRASLEMNLSGSESERSNITDYFPTEVYKLRHIESVSSNMSESDSYSISGSTTQARRKYLLGASVDASYGKSNAVGLSRTIETTDDFTTTQRRHNNSDSDSKSVRASVNYHQGFKTGFMRASMSLNLSKNTDDGWVVDTMGSTSFRTNLNNNAHGDKTNLSAGFAYSRRIKDLSSVEVGYNLRYVNEFSKQLSIDYLDDFQGKPDLLNTHDYTVNSTTNSLSLSYVRRSEDKKTRFFTGVEALATTINRDERLPFDYYMPRTFYSVAPTLNYMYQPSKQKMLMLFLRSNTETVSVEQLREVIDNRNPMSLSVGNPDLKQPTTTSASLSYNQTDAEQNRQWGASLNSGYTFNYIASKSHYFTEDTPLEKYDYTAQRGATLTSYGNVGGYFNINAALSYSKKFSAISSTFKTNLEYGYSQVPFYLNEVARTTDQNYMKLRLHFIAGFSANFKPEIFSTTQVGMFKNGPYGKSRYLEQQINGVIRSRFAKKYEANTKVCYGIYRNSESKRAATDAIYWNVDAGRKFGKKNQMTLLVGVVDLLNESDNRTTSTLNDYISTSTTTILGRYWFAELSFVF